jgi:hypothetical protein
MTNRKSNNPSLGERQVAALYEFIATSEKSGNVPTPAPLVVSRILGPVKRNKQGKIILPRTRRNKSW